MDTIGRFVYNACLPHTKDSLKAFCNHLNESNAEIYVVMAHKAVKLIELLIEQNLVDSNKFKGKIVSNSAIDFDPKTFLYKKIAIIDDIIISGSTISSTAAKLIQIGVNQDDLEIIAVARDKKYQTMRFTNSIGENILKCSYCFEDPECIELSYDLSKIFSYYGYLNDIDFPMYDPIVLSNEELSLILNPVLADVYDITNNTQHKKLMKSIVAFPSQIFRNTFWKKLGINLDNELHLKIRIFVNSYDNDKNLVYFTPMALFNEISIQKISNISERFNNDCIFSKINIINQTEYLTFLLSHIFLMEYFSSAKLENHLRIRTRSISYLFGVSNITTIQTVLKDYYIYCSTEFPNRFEYISPNLMGYQTKMFSELDEFILNDILLDPIIWWYTNFELPTRESIKNPSLHFLKDKDKIQNYLRRLSCGFSLSALKLILSKYNINFPDSEHTVSIFLDRAIDEGIIVPTTYINQEKQYVCRAYRHGEDLPFGIADKCRLLCFIKYLNTSFSKTPEADSGIAPITFEKLIVLFYQMGLRDGNVFNRFLGFDNLPILYQRFCVHGAIISSENPSDDGIGRQNHIYYEKNSSDPDNKFSQWLTWWMEDEGFIKTFKTKDNRMNVIICCDKIDKWLNENRRVCISEEIDIKLSQYADILGTWYGQNLHRKNEFKFDMTALVSCNNIYTFSSSLATELHYFMRYWEEICESEFADLRILNSDYDFTSFRRSEVAKALDSGIKKIEWYNSGRAIKAFQDTSDFLKNYSSNCYITWNTLWRDLKIESIADDTFNELINKSKAFLYFYYSIYEALTKGILFADNCSELYKKDERIDEFLCTYLSLVEKYTYIDNTLFQIFTYIDSYSSLKQKKKFLIEYVNDILSFSENTINKIEKRLSDYSNVYSLHYQSCLIFDILPLSIDKCQTTFMETWSELEDNEFKTKLNIFYFGNTLDCYERYGFFYDISTNNASDEDNPLLGIYDNICKSLSIRSYKYRTIFIPLLPDCATFEHDLRKNIITRTNILQESLLKHVESHFKDDVYNQMLLVCSKDTNKLYMEYVKNIKWDFCGEKQEVTIRGFTRYQLTIQKFYMAKPSIISAPKNQLSTIALFNENDLIGTGFLIQYKGEVYCLSCQHVFNEVHSNTIKAQLTGDYRKFKLKLLNKKRNPNNLPRDDIAILSPIWDGNIWMDLSKIFTEKDLVINTNDEEQRYKCFGFHQTEGDWIDNIEPVGLNSEQFYILKTDSNYDLAGFSGAAIVSSIGKVLGMHKRHTGDLISIIPGNIIREVLEDYINKKEQDW